MVYQFPTEWPDEVVAVSTLPEFQNATVRIIDPSLSTSSYDVVTDEYTYVGDPEIYSGQARLIAPRWGSDITGASSTNAFTETTILVQLPYQAVGRVRKGFKLFVDECTRNPNLIGLVFVATSDFQGSNAAARTVQFKLDGDSEVEDD